MSAADLLNEIQKLPFAEQLSLRDSLDRNLRQKQESMTDEEKEAEVDRLLMARGILKEIPKGLTDAEEEFEPVEITGEPVSETILKERR